MERILEVALDLIADGGLESMSMAKLAAGVDFTPGALYRYFPSKDALLSRLVERTLEGLRSALVAAVGTLPPRTSPLVRVFVLADAYRAFAHREPHRFGMLAMTLAAPKVVLEAPAHAEPVVRVMLAALQPLGEALATATEGGALERGDVSERTLCAFALLQGVLLMRKQARYAPSILDVDRLATRGLRGLLIGWGATKRAVDEAIARATQLADAPVPGAPL
ncbi:MAG: TetR/AcrR family transcriptional regulator [Kofleriaceae bacterium]|nr:TetR/AcrR family transcriptional regulator [Kofleriaceae bacterium]